MNKHIYLCHLLVLCSPKTTSFIHKDENTIICIFRYMQVNRTCGRHDSISGSGHTATLILELATRLTRVDSFPVRPLYPQEKSHPVPNEQLVGWSPEPVWMLRRKDKSLAPDGKRTKIPRLYTSRSGRSTDCVRPRLHWYSKWVSYLYH